MAHVLLMKTVRPEPVEHWIDEIQKHEPKMEVRVWPNIGNPADIEFALICKGPKSEKWPGRDLAKLPNLKFLASVNSGVEYLLNDPEIPASLPIVRVGYPGGDPMMTETIVMHVLRHHRRMHDYSDQQRKRIWQRLPEQPADRHTVGFLGFGAIAQPAAPILKSLGFKLAAWTRQRRSHDYVECFSGNDGLAQILQRSDILVLLLPLTAETNQIINARSLGMMRSGSSVINLARGEHINEQDLLLALDQHHIAAATLDVFAVEPLPIESRLWSHPKVTVMPHTARRVTAAAVVPQLMDNVRRAISGETLLYRVDRESGY